MDAGSIFRAMARNNSWSNHRLYGACAQLSHADLHATRVSFFPTIMKTLNHILIVDWFYTDSLGREGRGLAVFDGGDEPHGELGPLREAQRLADEKLLALVEGMRLDDIDAEVQLERSDRIQVERAGDVLLHLFQHQIHHRGQVHAMLAGTSVAPPQLDEFFMREELPLRKRDLEELGLPLS